MPQGFSSDKGDAEAVKYVALSPFRVRNYGEAARKTGVDSFSTNEQSCSFVQTEKV
jgi:hypothetical protein